MNLLRLPGCGTTSSGWRWRRPTRRPPLATSSTCSRRSTRTRATASFALRRGPSASVHGGLQGGGPPELRGHASLVLEQHPGLLEEDLGGVVFGSGIGIGAGQRARLRQLSGLPLGGPLVEGADVGNGRLAIALPDFSDAPDASGGPPPPAPLPPGGGWWWWWWWWSGCTAAEASLLSNGSLVEGPNLAWTACGGTPLRASLLAGPAADDRGCVNGAVAIAAPDPADASGCRLPSHCLSCCACS